MPVLRSREIIISPTSTTKPPNLLIKTLEKEEDSIEPLTPARAAEQQHASVKELTPVESGSDSVPARRRSLRSKRKSSAVYVNLVEEVDLTAATSLLEAETVGRENGRDKGTLNLRSGRNVVKWRIGDINAVHLSENGDELNSSELWNIEIKKEEKYDGIVQTYISDSPGSIGLIKSVKGHRGDESGSVVKNKKKLSRVESDMPGIEAKSAGTDGMDKGSLSLRSGRKIVKRRFGDRDTAHSVVTVDEDETSEVLRNEIKKEEISAGIALSDVSIPSGNIASKELGTDQIVDKSGSDLKNRRRLSNVNKGKVKTSEESNLPNGSAVFGSACSLEDVRLIEEMVELDQSQMGEEDTGTGMGTRRRHGKEEKRKVKVFGEELQSDSDVVSYTAPLLDNMCSKKLKIEPLTFETEDVKHRKALSREEKGKRKMVEDGLLTDVAAPLDLSLRLGVENLTSKTYTTAVNLGGDYASVQFIENKKNVEINSSLIVENVGDAVDNSIPASNPRQREFKERFRDIARKNASRFAHFSSHEAEENHVIDQPDIEMARVEAEGEIVDWPGPFSTALKIIRDREANVQKAPESSCLNKSKSGSITWVPKKETFSRCLTKYFPKLEDLCIEILAKNADAVTSLEGVPDLIRHKLSRTLCDSRKMDAYFLDLLVCGSPTEIRIKDCSWLSEEQFTKAFQRCDASQLMVLQLDQCGRCLPDYVLFATLARTPKALPALTAMSMKGACRFSDAGLSALVASAPVLRSINLSQCSLLTCNGINTLADSLGSILKELYMDDCQNFDPVLMLPAILKLQKLEVLSLAGIEIVSDLFIRELVAARGQNYKELVLADCTFLTDASLKAIAETCSGLCSLDLSNLRRLTDSTLGYLANGCREIERLKLCRNAFSDEAVAAYLEASGDSLTELSLNNVKKVGDNTALSLSRRSGKLLTLDLSWCRNLADEAVGLIVDSCSSLKVLKLFGCTQITNLFVDGHSNSQLQIIGLKMTPILKNLNVSEPQLGPLHYSSVSS